MSARVKICGLTSAADRDAAVRAGADAVGFITGVPVDTPRELSPSEAERLAGGVPPLVTSVLVTMPDSVQDAVNLQAEVGADAIQIHGTLPPEKVGGLRARVDAPVVAAVDLSADIEEYAAAADAVLVDSTDEEGGGGTGETHDWERTRAVRERIETPLILAGGLTPENVEAAIDAVDPFAVDTASGVERTGGEKDTDAVAAFVDRARGVRDGGEDV
ncbi:phosphoribosylanthranilate isomerase [Halovenus sp. WSH3]|uniref:N-(5'-phosphoribosyl)anthranilate isomerase n=1 Tax=Halovenus carboxidivorans TaxID=2692199 RepID=A0A6B0TBJ6_9EURY|nr:phosphoribosylanthranilate isomerase [Halovenus carboxidivorans]MXR52280.1 phosphoribosylanthranilate isomerase [Halovenus carboxidivorans]